ncbi:MAG: oligosaccharide flippase family protein [Saprospiraceae bacterium]|nr:oligosaccharide flippase family protein [Saprospiraceae bacterium]
MKREFVVNVSLLLVSNLLIKVYFLLGIDRNFQLALGAEQYGLYYSLFNFTLVFQFINDFGLQNLINRFVSQNRDDSLKRLQEFAVMKILLSTIYIGVIVIMCKAANYPSDYWILIFHLAINQVLASAISFNRAGISGLGFYRQDSFFSVMDRFILILMGSALLWIPFFHSYLNIHGFIWIQSISLAITFILTYIFLKKKGLVFQRLFPDVIPIKNLLISTLPFAFIYLCGSIYNKADVVLLHRLHEHGAEQAGIYASAMRLFEAASMFSLAIGGLLLAMFSRLHEQADKLSGLFKLSVKWLLVGTLLVSTLGFFYAAEWVDILYKRNDPLWIQTFAIVMMAFLPASLNFILGAFYQAVHKERVLLIFYALAAILCILLNWKWIPEYGAQATAIVAVVVHGTLFFIQAIYIWLKSLVNITRDFVLFTFVFCGLSWLLAFGIYQFELDWKVKIGLTTTSILGIAFAFRILSIVEMRHSSPEETDTN